MNSSLQQFHSSVAVSRLAEALQGCSIAAEELAVHPLADRIHLYRDGADVLAISELPDSRCYLEIQGSEWIGNRADLEAILAAWAADEGYFKN